MRCFIRNGAWLWLHGFSEARNDRCVQRIGFRELSAGLGEGADLPWIDHRQRQSFGGKRGGDDGLEAAGRFKHDQSWFGHTQPGKQFAQTRFVAGDRKRLARRTNRAY